MVHSKRTLVPREATWGLEFFTCKIRAFSWALWIELSLLFHKQLVPSQLQYEVKGMLQSLPLLILKGGAQEPALRAHNRWSWVPMRTLFQSLSGCQGVEIGLNDISLITQFMDSLGTEFRFLKDKLHRAFVENEPVMQVKPIPQSCCQSRI